MARRDDAEMETRELDTTVSQAAIDTSEMRMTVEEWTTEPVFGACSVCAGPAEDSYYCVACRKFFRCAACEDSAIARHHLDEGGCAYLDQWRKLGEPRASKQSI